jgi:hypothetical protein
VALRAIVAETREAVRAFAVESWLTRFPGFVDDLAPRLRTFSQALATSTASCSEDLGDVPVDPRAPYWDMLKELRASRAAGRAPSEDHDWYRARALLAISEFSAASRADLEAAYPPSEPSVAAAAAAAGPSSVLPQIQTLSSPAESSDSASEAAVVVARPRPRILLSESEPVGSGGRSRGVKRARPVADSTVRIRVRASLFSFRSVFDAGRSASLAAMGIIAAILARRLRPVCGVSKRTACVSVPRVGLPVVRALRPLVLPPWRRRWHLRRRRPRRRLLRLPWPLSCHPLPLFLRLLLSVLMSLGGSRSGVGRWRALLLLLHRASRSSLWLRSSMHWLWTRLLFTRLLPRCKVLLGERVKERRRRSRTFYIVALRSGARFTVSFVCARASFSEFKHPVHCVGNSKGL